MEGRAQKQEGRPEQRGKSRPSPAKISPDAPATPRRGHAVSASHGRAKKVTIVEVIVTVIIKGRTISWCKVTLASQGQIFEGKGVIFKSFSLLKRPVLQLPDNAALCRSEALGFPKARRRARKLTHALGRLENLLLVPKPRVLSYPHWGLPQKTPP